MDAFEIQGGNKLKGTLVPQGAKNEALQVSCSVLLTSEEVIIKNIPDIRDVNILIELLKDLGVKVNNTAPKEFSFKADNINFDYLSYNTFNYYKLLPYSKENQQIAKERLFIYEEELIAAACHPSRYFEWCLDNEEKIDYSIE